MGAVVATCQLVIHVGLYAFGAWLTARWSWLHKRVDATRERLVHLDGGYLTLTLVGALLGTPPLIAMVVLAPSFQIRPVPLLTLVYVGRTTRFAVLAWGGPQLLEWVGISAST